MSKIPIYFMPGLAAGPEIFENLELDLNIYELNYLKWIKPISLDEPISNYAIRMIDEINHLNPVLIGVSFGGILVQEMSKLMDTRKIIIISSVKSNKEFPKRYKIFNTSKLYKLFPTKIVSNFESYTKFFVGKSLQKRAKLYEKYLSVRNEDYLKWSIHNVLNWQQNESIKNIIHVHGNNDQVFPIKNIKNAIVIESGTHVMILNKARRISKIIHENLTC